MDINFSPASLDDIKGISFHSGYIFDTASNINSVFGNDTVYDSECNKTFNEWHVKLNNNISFTVYDWKSDRPPFDNEKFYYHIGTIDEKTTQIVIDTLCKAGLNAYQKSLFAFPKK